MRVLVVFESWIQTMHRECHGLACRRAAVSLIFAIALIPLMMLLGLAIDFGFYNEAQSQLDMAADAAAMHAARVAAQLQQQNDPSYLTKGQAAGAQWFTVQQGLVPQVQAGAVTPQVQLTYDQKANQISSQVTYTGIVQTHFAGFFPASWPNYPNWGVAGAATAVISIPSYTEVTMLIDNSSSMMIASTDEEIRKMESLTPCSTQGSTNGDGQTIDYNYSWVYNTGLAGGAYNPPYSAYSNVQLQDAMPDSQGRPVFIPYGYGTFYYTQNLPGHPVNEVADITPPPGSTIAKCDPNFKGPLDECLSPPLMLVQPNANTTIPVVNGQGLCVSNGVVTGGGAPSAMAAPGTTIPPHHILNPPPPNNYPLAPCAFACHNDKTGSNNDFYGLARQNNIQLRFDVVQAAAAKVIDTMSTSPSKSVLSVGVYQFNAPGVVNPESGQSAGIQQVYPDPGSNTFGTPEAGNDWATASSATGHVTPPITQNNPDTYFENAMQLLGNDLKPAGTGTLPTEPRKNLFIVTDGMDDYNGANGRTQGAIDPTSCDKFKNDVSAGGLGFTVYVLYIQYYPLPNPYYLDWSDARAQAEPLVGSPVYNALQACASPGAFYVAQGSPDSIDGALQAMLAAAIGAAGRFSQ
jgi:Flp pilus assembly protein TadG